jgi:hypothetical protein
MSLREEKKIELTDGLLLQLKLVGTLLTAPPFADFETVGEKVG